MKKILAWHWSDGEALHDGQPFAIGKIYRLPEGQKPAMCDIGYHGSKRITDALRYASGSVLSRVELRGTILRDTDKLCASERTHLWKLDCERMLWEFACACAERALRRERKAGREPDALSWKAVQTRRAWLAGYDGGHGAGEQHVCVWSAPMSGRDAHWQVRDPAARAVRPRFAPGLGVAPGRTCPARRGAALEEG